MQVNRGFIRTTALLVALVLAASAAVVVWWHRCGELDPATADREELFRWLVTYDLSEVSPQTRWLMAKRLDEEFCDEIDWEAIGGRLTAEHRARLWSNIPLILEPWFMEKVDAYFACRDSQRTAFLDRTIDRMSIWSGLDRLCPESGNKDNTAETPCGVKALLFERIGYWQSRAEPDQEERIDQFVTAVRMRWLYRQLAEQLDRLRSPGSKQESP